MKRLLGNPTDGDHDQINNDSMYTSSDFQTMLDGLDEGGFIDETGHATPAEKKRRLSVEQVKALEKNFEVENKLEPERKLKLAQELGLQPRQVAVWFQNRRARYKSKQLERDYSVLEANYDGLKLNYEKLRRDNEALLKEINELKAKLSEVGKSELLAAKEDAMILSDAENKKPNNLETDQVNVFLDPKSEDEAMAEEATEMKINGDLDNDLSGDDNILLCDSFNKDGSCDSDSSAILNEEYMNYNKNKNSPNAAISSSYQLSFSKANSGERINGDNNVPVHQPMKIEEHNLFVHEEESCTDLFSDEQAPSLTWICTDDWN